VPRDQRSNGLVGRQSYDAGRAVRVCRDARPIIVKSPGVVRLLSDVATALVPPHPARGEAARSSLPDCSGPSLIRALTRLTRRSETGERGQCSPSAELAISRARGGRWHAGQRRPSARMPSERWRMPPFAHCEQWGERTAGSKRQSATGSCS